MNVLQILLNSQTSMCHLHVTDGLISFPWKFLLQSTNLWNRLKWTGTPSLQDGKISACKYTEIIHFLWKCKSWFFFRETQDIIYSNNTKQNCYLGKASGKTKGYSNGSSNPHLFCHILFMCYKKQIILRSWVDDLFSPANARLYVLENWKKSFVYAVNISYV